MCLRRKAESSGLLPTRVHLIVICHTGIYDLCTFLYECYISHFKTFKMYSGKFWNIAPERVSAVLESPFWYNNFLL
jgi:hypothetical protein